MSSASALSVQASLTLLTQNCAHSIAALGTKSDAQELPLSALRTDFISLLSVIYSNTTKLSIALNPSNPTYSAAVIPLKDLITYTSTLASNASSFIPNVHGRALTAEIHSTARSVLTALQELVHAHLSLLIKPANNDDVAVPIPYKNGGDAYLAKTGVVHELIAQAKADEPQGLSRSNLIAVRKRWQEHLGIISDAAATLEIEAFPLADGDDDDNDFDDGWDDPELGFTMSGKLSPEQVELAKTILNVARRTSALFHDIYGTLLTPGRAPAQSLPNALLDDLLDSAPPLVAAADNLATQLYDAPEDPSSHLAESRDSFARALTFVNSVVKGYWKGKEDPRPASEKGSQTYFIEQFSQLNEAVEAVQWTILT